MSSLHILPFTLRNPLTLSLDSNGPFPTFYRLVTLRLPSIQTLDLTQYAGRIILITGATSGCGLECARAFARVDCHLVLTARSRERGEEVVRQLQNESEQVGSRAVVDLLELDMVSFQSIQLLPSRLKTLGITQLDIAILNAGTYQTDFHVCAETGWEQVMQVNFLATAALTIILRPYLTYERRGYLLAIASEAHAWADPQKHSIQDLLDQFNRPESEPYPSYQRYHISKLLLILWIRHISTREEWAQTSVAAVSPGFASTSLWRDFNGLSIARVIEYIFCRSCGQGAGQYVCALDDLVCGRGHGGFWSDAGWRAPSANVSSKYGQELQDGIYTHVVGILKSLGIVDSA